MSEMVFKDYLSPNLSQIRHSIKGIDDSYNNYWDLYAELIQNSVDAIRQSLKEVGLIQLKIDCANRTVSIYDNGIGIDNSELPNLLKPFSTNKSQNVLTIGEKGVGLKFAIFSGNSFKIKTGNDSGSCEAHINGAFDWKNADSDTNLALYFTKLNEEYEGTLVEISDIRNEYIFNLSFEQIKFVLLTKTALGSTIPLWGNDKNIQITLTYKDLAGAESTEQLPFKYKSVLDYIPSNSKIDLDSFVEWTKERDRTDQEKINKLRDKVIYRIGEFTHANVRKIKYLACFVPKRRIWSDLTVPANLASEEQMQDETWLSDYSFCTLSNSITLSVKGMPTGIVIDHPTSGYAGYWSNVFILFEDPLVRFDIGRKSIHGKSISIHKDYSKKIFNDFLQFVTKYISGDLSFEPTEWNRDESFAQIDRIANIGSEAIKFQKSPSGQEASVAAIFFECVGNGKIANITPLIAGYRNRYDLYAIWNNKKLIVEFKSHLRNISKDFSDARKMFDEIDCVVCWEVTDTDRNTLLSMGITVDPIDETMFSANARQIPHSTHTMMIASFNKPIYVIDIKKIIET
jgi:hypothetical protein